jgi:hypothetical protein
LPVETAEKGVSVLPLLLNPIIEVPGLQIFRTPGQIRVRHPQPIGKKTLRSGSYIHRPARYPHLFEAVKLHLMNRNGFIKMVEGILMNFGDDVFESCDVGHDNSPFYVGLIPAQGTDDFGGFAVDDDDVIAQVISKGDVMSAIETKLLAIQPLDNLFQGFHILVELFLLFGHDFLQK